MKKKGFTLIELLAIIVILAIIAVVTVPIILGIVDEAKKKAAEDSAHGYKEAVNRLYASELMRNSDYSLDDKIYTVSELDTAGVSISGAVPEGNSWVNIVDDELVSACLQFGDYRVTISDGVVGNAEKGECFVPGKPVVYSNKGDSTPKIISNVSTDLLIGDYVKIGDDGFYVINTNNSGYVVLLSEYNLINDEINSIWKQGGQDDDYQITFSQTEYWKNQYSSTYSPSSGQMNGYYAFVYRDFKDQNNNYLNNLYVPMESYKSYLISNGVSDSINVRPMSWEESLAVGANSGEAPEWLYNQLYWLGTDFNFDNGNTHYWRLCSIYYSGDTYCYNSFNETYGIRPVIEILPIEFN